MTYQTTIPFKWPIEPVNCDNQRKDQKIKIGQEEYVVSATGTTCCVVRHQGSELNNMFDEIIMNRNIHTLIMEKIHREYELLYDWSDQGTHDRKSAVLKELHETVRKVG